MAVGAFTLYSLTLLALGSETINLGADNFNCILCTNAYVPAPNTDATYANVSPSEVAAGGGYSTGGVTLGGVTWTNSTNTSTFAAQSAVWANSTITARYAVVVRRAGASPVSSDKLLGYVDLTGGGSVSTSAATFQINWNNASTPSAASTLFTLTHNP